MFPQVPSRSFAPIDSVLENRPVNGAQVSFSGWIAIGTAATITCVVFEEWGIAVFAGVVTLGSLLFLLWDIHRTRKAR